ncbi:MAG: hypothetical protein ABI175_08515 [Polyangiales bacterium]
MVSSTQQSSRIRKRKTTTNGKANKRGRRAHGTIPFAVHPEGYDKAAADARPEVKAVAAKPKKGPKKAKGVAKKPAAK